ncbi:MAG: hypothetical protein ABS61_05560 [Microbacterium sp. SCN 70-18]|nr:MAG: hypothetical protein ABS61_05560 [Microbacterium sp. SCN 70-18]
MESCPDRPIATFIQLEESGSALDPAITKERLASVETLTERTLVCTGHLTVTVFSAGSGASATLYDGDVTISTPTVNARLKKVPAANEEITRQIAAAFTPAVDGLPEGGSDVLAGYRLMGEQAAQFPEHRSESYLYTDGLVNMGSVQITGALSKEQAAALAEQVPVPTLPDDAAITVVGLGRVTGDPVPSPVIEGMVFLYDALCQRTGAAQCLSVTDLR